MRQLVASRLLDSMMAGQVYRARELRLLSNNLARDLQRLVEQGSLVQAAPGLYYRPKMTRFGSLPATNEELVRAFLDDDKFLLLSLDSYNALGLGLTQLYNETIVYNRKRHGRFMLDGRMFSFRRPKDFPGNLHKEFLYVDVLNNRKELLEETAHLEQAITVGLKGVNKKKLLHAAVAYGKVATRKFFEELLD